MPILKSVVDKLFWKNHVMDNGPAIGPDAAEEVYRALGGVQGAQMLLKSLLVADRDRYFKATTDVQRAAIKGQYLRTLQLLRHIRFEPSLTPKGNVARKDSPARMPARYATGA